ncbi:MAG TPA: hypothetical protein P5513_04150 [Candidatus Diapherotrites archaeon]|nr:hypothetical protein [Candidatus Diapherotrites archaeon]
MPQIIDEKYPRSPYQLFRSVGERFKPEMLQKSGAIQKTFDEPTYLTFKLKFYSDNTSLESTNFDKFPMPLFNKYKEDDLKARMEYSSYQYLRDNNEIIRANMLEDFIDGWNEIQMNNQWYFQEISGLDSILSINPERGMRVPTDGKITIKMLEALDLRITHLLNLYRKIAWDDTYQRWILPDMMRYFKLAIYITEFRTFHKSNFTSKLMPGSEVPPMILSIIEKFTPVYVLELERCEIDITSISAVPDSLSISEPQMREVQFSVKVGNLQERYINPILNYFYYDWLINGFSRSIDTIPITTISPTGVPTSPVVEIPNNSTKLSNTTDPYSSPIISDYAKGDILSNTSHESVKPFIESGNIDNITNASPNYSTDINSVNPIDPATWVGNTITAGKALLKNLVNSKIDQLKMNKIPGLGISLNEAISAIQSKNVFTLFGVARRAIEESVKNTLPSQDLEGKLVDTHFKSFLESITLSEATNEEDIKIKEAANILLNDRGQWEKIKDLSKATDLVSTALKEINSTKGIENKDYLKNAYSQKYVPLEVKDYLVFEGLPSSLSTNNKIVEGGKIEIPNPGEATSNKLEKTESITSPKLGSTDGDINPSITPPKPSSELKSNAGERRKEDEYLLGSYAQGGMERPKPSERLSQRLEGDKLKIPNPGEAVDDDKIEANKLPQPNNSKATNNKIDK